MTETTTPRPTMTDVLDVPHDLYEGGRLVLTGLTAARVCASVRNANYQGLDMEQEPSGTIRILTRRYVPQSAPAVQSAAHPAR